jgi:BMFP domain-containing protein YqiC
MENITLTDSTKNAMKRIATAPATSDQGKRAPTAPSKISELEDRIKTLEEDLFEQCSSNTFCFEALTRRIEALETAQNQQAYRLIELDRALAPAPAGPVTATPLGGAPMTEDYKANPEQWAFLRDCAANGPTPLRDQSAAQNSCILELRARVEALEEAQRPTVKESSATAPAGSLVEQMASVGVSPFYAKAAIREVAAWLDGQMETGAAHILSEEADRG